MTFRSLVPPFFLVSIVSLVIASMFRLMAGEHADLESEWLLTEAAYLDRVETVVGAERFLTALSGAVLPTADFARRTRYSLRFESDVSVKIEAVNTFEKSLGEYLEKLRSLSVAGSIKGLERYALIVALTESPVSSSRDSYNLAVRKYNTKISIFPRNWFAAPFGYGKQGLLSMNIAALSL